jgi:polysaccharide biosynthesis transport protein
MFDWQHAMTEGSSGALQPAVGGNTGRPDLEAQPLESIPNYVGGTSAESDGLWECCRILRKYVRLLILLMASTTLLALLVTLPQSRIFRATTSVEVLRVNEDFLDTRAVNPTSSVADEYQPEYDIQTEKAVLQSRSVLERALSKNGVEQRLLASAERSATMGWRAALRFVKAASLPLGHEQALRIATEGLTVRSQPNSRVLELTADSTDPQLSADLANATTAAFVEWNFEQRWTTNQHTREWMSQQLGDLKSKLQESEGQLLKYAQTSGLLFTSEKDNVDEQKLRYFQEELGKATVGRVDKQSRFELTSKVPPESLPEILDDRTLQDYRTQLTTLKKQLAELSAAFTQEYPKVAKIQAQIDAVTSASEAARLDVMERIRNEYDVARTRENLLAAKYEAQARLMSNQAGNVAQYNILRRDVDTTRALYEAVLQKSKEADMLTAMKASNIQVIDPAQPPKTPYSPKLGLNLSLGLLSGLLLGIGLVMVRERGGRVRGPGDAEFLLNLRELGAIPSLSHEGSRAQRLVSHSGIALPSWTNGERADLTIWHRRASPFADSFRDTLVSILCAKKNGVAPRVIVVSSANPGEGKTTVVSNLAIALAEMNRRVLLVDGDTRKPQLHRIFQVDDSPGVSEILAGQSAPVLRETNVPNLVVLPAGASANASLLFGSRLSDLFTLLRKQFDVILVDTPCVLNLPDARMFGLQADAVILVVRADFSTRGAIQLARQRLQDGGNWLLGTILNDWNPKTGPYGCGYGEYYRKTAEKEHV